MLVVGAAASGVQIASELAQAGREVTLAIGRHIRLPRNYRGMDIQWWLDASGLLDRRWDEIADIETARHQPSLQIVGTPEHPMIGEGITTIIWATGFTPHYPWLNARVFDDRGEISHDGGVITDAPGMYVLGLPFMRRRRSTFIDGADGDADAIATHLVDHLGTAPVVV